MTKKGINNPAGAITTAACTQTKNVGADHLHQFIQSMQRGMEKPIGLRTRRLKSHKENNCRQG
jgi:hypothetical protein